MRTRQGDKTTRLSRERQRRAVGGWLQSWPGKRSAPPGDSMRPRI